MTKFTLDLGKLTKAARQSPRAIGLGGRRAFDDIRDDWVRGAVDLAPIDSANLRRQISGKVGGLGDGAYVEVKANAIQDTGGKRFNYAYYIHEQNAGGRTLKISGAEKKFLDVALERRKAEYKRWLENEIMAELKKMGW